MPALVLLDDDGRELFRGAVSQTNVQILARFVAQHMETFRGIAAFKRAIDQFVDGGEPRRVVQAAAAPKRARRRKVVR